MRIKKLAAAAAMAVTMMGVGTGAQALLIDANDELGFVGAVLQGVDNAVDRETDELVTDSNSPVRHLATDEGSLLDEILANDGGLADDVVRGLIAGDDAVALDDVEDALCIVFEGGIDCEDDDDDDEDGLLGELLDGTGILAIAQVGAFIGLF